MINAIKIYITILATFITLSSQANSLISVKELISYSNISNVQINPKGSLFTMYGYSDDNLKIVLGDIENKNIIDVFSSKKNENIYAHNLKWLDNNSFYYETYNQKNTNKKHHAWIVNISNTNEQLTLKKSRVNAYGFIIDALKDVDNTLIYGAYVGKKHKLKLYKTNINSLLKNNFKNQIQLTSKLKEAKWYGTDSEHNIRFSSIYDEEEHIVSHWYLDKDDEWQKYYEYNPSNLDFKPIGFLANGQLAVITNIESDLAALYEFDVKNKTLGKLLYSHQQYDLTNAEYNPKDLTIKSITYKNAGEEHTEYFNTNDENLYQLVKDAFDDQQIIEVSQNSNNTMKILFVFSSNTPGKYYYFNSITKKALFLGAKKEFSENYLFPKMKNITIKSNEGHQIEAYLTQASKDTTNNVLLVMPHGGPIGVRDDKRFDSEVQYLVSRGYSVLQVNFRGSEGYGKKYKNSGRGQFGQRIEQDISTIVSYVNKNFNYEQFCSIGASYGGYSAVMLAMKHPDLYKCVVARFGVFDLPLIFNDRNTKLKPSLIELWENVVGKNDGSLKTFSPVYFAEKLTSPILITAGKKDTRASFEHSNRMRMALEQQQVDVEHVYYPRSAHGHNWLINAQHELAYIDNFIRRKLKLGAPKGDNSKNILIEEYKLLAWGFKKSHIAENRPELLKWYEKLADDLINE